MLLTALGTLTCNLSASGMHEKTRNDFSRIDLIKRDTKNVIADLNNWKNAVSGQSMGPDMTLLSCLTRVIAMGRSRGL